MGNLRTAITLRILILITASLFMYSRVTFGPGNLLTGSQRYITFSFWIVCFLIYVQQYRYEKSRANGRIILKEMILPEFNSDDEREAVLTGKAAKAALATIIVFSVFLIFGFSFILTFDVNLPLLLYFAIITVPISGLIAYYFSYRYYYLN